MIDIFVVKDKDVEELIRIQALTQDVQENFNDFVETFIDFDAPYKFNLRKQNNLLTVIGGSFSDILRQCLKKWISFKAEKGTVQALLYVLQSCGLNTARNAVNQHWEHKRGVAANRFELQNIRKISYGESGITYRNLLETLEDSEITELRLEDTYISSDAQIANFKEFLKTAVDLWKNLNKFTLRTLVQKKEVKDILERMMRDVDNAHPGITFELETVEEAKAKSKIHDRFLRIGNKAEVYLGRGLDIYAQQGGPYETRHCKEFYAFYSTCP